MYFSLNLKFADKPRRKKDKSLVQESNIKQILNAIRKSLHHSGFANAEVINEQRARLYTILIATSID